MIKLEARLGGKISTGQWENEEPFFSIIEDIKVKISDEKIEERLLALNAICRSSFDKVAIISNTKRIRKELTNIRFYVKDNKEFPSVTSIVNFKRKISEYANITPEKLTLLAHKGTIVHKQVEIYAQTGVWKEPKDIPEIFEELVSLKGSDIKVDDINFLAFLEAYPLEFIDQEFEVYNDEHMYAGRVDGSAVYNGKKTLYDVKTGAVNKQKTLHALMQLSAYAQCKPEIEQIMVIPLNPNVKQGFSKAVIADPKDYFPLFLKRRAEFKKELGI